MTTAYIIRVGHDHLSIFNDSLFTIIFIADMTVFKTYSSNSAVKWTKYYWSLQHEENS
jgi:hypothetical protein